MRIWAAFWLLGLIWGSSFLLIRVGVELVHPLHLVMIRVGIAAAGLCLVVMIRRRPIPRDWRTLRNIGIIGIGNSAIPFTLIAWGEKTVESGMASVLQSTAALFGLIAAHFAFKDERITPQKITGILLGFVGVIVLSSRNWQGDELITGGLLGQLAIVGASLCYGTFTTLSRKVIQGQVEPIVLSAVAMMSAALFEMVLVIGGWALFDVPLTTPADLPLSVLGAVISLGVVNTFLAYLLYYEVVRALGAARATMVTYVVPVVGVFLGVVFLNELVDLPLVLGALFIFLGISIVNLKVFRRLNLIGKPIGASGD